MKQLTSIFEEVGCQAVRTYIRSGNVVFRFADAAPGYLEKRLSECISKRHSLTPHVLLLDGQRLNQAIRECPFQSAVGNQLHFFFLSAVAKSPDLASLSELKSPTEQFQLNDRVLYLLAPAGIGRSKLAAAIERCLGVPTTARNWNTIRKLQSMLSDAN